ncbi:hypothetical protein HDU76_008589, partial [Blyttiomyces sp. JEL0837]
MLHFKSLVAFLLIAASTINVSAIVNRKALVLLQQNEDTTVPDLLTFNNVDFDSVPVDSKGLKYPVELAVNATVGKYCLIIMTSRFLFLYDGLWLPSLNGTALDNIHNYLATYGAKLIILGDAPNATLGVSPVYNNTGIDNAQNIIFADVNSTYAIEAHIPTIMTLSSKGLFHYPGVIINPAVAKAAMLFDAGPPPYDNQTVAIAAINHTKGFQQLSLYVPCANWSFTCATLGKVYLGWGIPGSVRIRNLTDGKSDA